jgi:hypothetical protein
MAVTLTLFSFNGALVSADTDNSSSGNTVISAELLSSYAKKGYAIVEISTKDDFTEFAEKCVLDSYSEKKYFYLTSDISLGVFDGVPSFGGIFDGNGYTISGVTINSAGSDLGLFRYVEKSGTVKNLNVRGTVTPTGTEEECGGIAGVNKGKIIGCTFTGTVKGKSTCGGIAGLNEESGLIANCTSEGMVQASHYAGGIAGQSDGSIIHCTNNASVNTNEYDTSIDLESLDIDDIYSAGQTADIADIGGITGYSDGSVQDCVNNGNIGYPHVGYNIGGIAGRQIGYISSCVNYGTVNGRKDIGGIAGQAEPHISLLFSERTLNKLREQLTSLNSVIDVTLNDAEARSDVTSDSTNNILDELSTIKGGINSFLDETESIINSNIDSVNELSTRMQDLVDMAAPVADSFSDASDTLAKAMDDIAQAADLLEETGNYAGDGMDVLFPALGELSDALDAMAGASDSMDSSLASLQEAMGDEDVMTAALDSLSQDFADLSDALARVSTAASEALTALNTFADSPEYQTAKSTLTTELARLSEIAKKLSESSSEASGGADDLSSLIDTSDSDDSDDTDFEPYVKNITDSIDSEDLKDMFDSISKITGALSDIASSQAAEQLKSELMQTSSEASAGLNDLGEAGENTSEDAETLYDNTDINSLYDFIRYVKEANSSISQSSDPLQAMVKCIEDSYDYFDHAGASAVSAVSQISDAASSASDASAKVKEAFDGITDILDYFSGKDELTFTGATDDLISQRDSVSDMASDLIDLCGDFTSDADSTVDVLAEDMKQINTLASDVSDTVLDLIDELEDTSTDISEYTEDISADDTVGFSSGKIAGSTNYGSINGDVSVGGIAGAMAVEYDYDPEGDIETVGDRSLNFMYQSKTVVRSCKNYGEVISKKNSAGGIAGDMETGCLITCYGFGDVTSTDGSYVGGVAGQSQAAIYGCYAKCRISGTDFIGGIAGEGNDLSDCRSFVLITEGTERVGAVAGYVNGTASNNTFIDSGIGGIDGISYKGKACPVSYVEMVSGNAPEEFRKVVLRFIVDDKLQTEIDCTYGQSFDKNDLPEIPHKVGCFAEWEDFDTDSITFDLNINAVYTSYITSIASAEQRANGLPVIIAEGSFTSDDTLSASPESGSDSVTSDKWSVKLPSDGSTLHTVRYLPTVSPEKAVVKVTENGIERAVEATADGQYLVFAVSSTSFTVSVTEKETPWVMYGIIAAAAVAVLVIVIIAVKKKHKKV